MMHLHAKVSELQMERRSGFARSTRTARMPSCWEQDVADIVAASRRKQQRETGLVRDFNFMHQFPSP